jgi:hypothetical protein
LVCIIGIIFLARLFKWSGTAEWAQEYITMNISDKSIAYIGTSEWSKTRIKNGDKLYAANTSILVDNQEGFHVQGKNQYILTDIDKGSELIYKSQSMSGGSISVSKWRVWVQAEKSPLEVQLKTFSIDATPGNIFLVEQNNIYSTAYALKGDISVRTRVGNFTLVAGNRIMLRDSDITDDANIWQFAGEIDESISQNPLFIQNWGEALLKEAVEKKKATTESGTVLDADSTHSGTSLSSESGKYIKINQPIDGTVVQGSKITIMGDLLSKDVKRVTLNDHDTSVSPVNESFVLQDLDVESEIFNIVYKAYNSENQLLDKWVVTVYGPKWVSTSQKLVPENFPLSNKDFQIFFPKENPYKTTESLVKVQWVVPKNTVQYIVVNDYRLQKFIANSSTWYYFANTETETMKEWINIYNIKFYNSDNKLLYTQLFTIVKESKNATISSEVIQ